MFFKIIAFYIFTLSTFAFSTTNNNWPKKTYNEISLGDSILENPNDAHVLELLQEFISLQPLSELPLIIISEKQQLAYEKLTLPEASKSYTEYLQYVAKIAAQYFNHGDVILPEYAVVIRKCILHINNIIGKFNAAHKIFIKELEDIILEPEEKLILALNYKTKDSVNLFYQFLLLKKLRVTLETLSLPGNLANLNYKQTLDFLLTSSILDDSSIHYNKFNLNLILQGTPIEPSHFYSGRRISGNTLTIISAEETLSSDAKSLLFSTEEQLLLSKIITPMTSKIELFNSNVDSYITFDVAIDLPFYILHAHDKTLTHKEFMLPIGCHFIDVSHPPNVPLKTSLNTTLGDHIDHDFDHLALYFMKIFSKGLLDILASDQVNKPELVKAYLKQNALEQGLTWDSLREFFHFELDISSYKCESVFDLFLSNFFDCHQEMTCSCEIENDITVYPHNFSPKIRKDILKFLPRFFSRTQLFKTIGPIYYPNDTDVLSVLSQFEIFLQNKESEFLTLQEIHQPKK